MNSTAILIEVVLFEGIKKPCLDRKDSEYGLEELVTTKYLRL
jgi:hypothetical protein